MDCPHYSLPIMRGPVFEELRGAPSAGVDIDLPAVLRAPQSEEATVFSTLAADVARQVLRAEINAQLIPSVTYVKGKGLLLRSALIPCVSIILRRVSYHFSHSLCRYFTSSSATELLISCKDLRMRDPRTGLPRADFHGRLLEEANNG